MRDLINLIETLDNPTQYRWDDRSTEDCQLLVAEFEIDDAVFIVEFKKPYYDGVWTIVFARNGSQEITGTGSARIVFSTVARIVIDFIKKKRPRYFSFAAALNEPSRVRLYDRLSRMLIELFREYHVNAKNTVAFKKMSFERESDPYVAPPLVPEPEPVAEMTPEEWDDMEAYLDELSRSRRQA